MVAHVHEIGDGYRAWRREGGVDRAVVFVHGWGGDSDHTWRSGRKSLHLAEQLIGAGFVGWDYWSFGHHSGPHWMFSTASLQSSADEIHARWINHLEQRYRHVVVIAHSEGGILARKVMLQRLEDSKARARPEALLLVASPSNGTELARLGGVFSQAARDMVPLTTELAELNEKWVQAIFGHRPMSGFGPPAAGCGLFVDYLVGGRDSVVRRESAAFLAAAAGLSPQFVEAATHTSITRPLNSRKREFEPYQLFLERAAKHIDDRAGLSAQSIARIAHLASGKGFLCSSPLATSLRDEITLTPGTDGYLDVRQVTSIRGTRIPDTIRAGVRIEHVEWPSQFETFDFELFVGHGPEQLRAPRFEPEKCTAQIRTSHPLAVDPLQSEISASSRVWTFHRHHEDPVWGDIVADLFVPEGTHLRSGWYYYEFDPLVTQGAQIVLHSPMPTLGLTFPVSLRPGGAPRSSVATPSGYTTTVSLEGPVPKGTTVLFIFQPSPE